MEKQACAIPEAFVPQSYLNDPETEDLIFGDELVENMVVLVEDIHARGNPDHFDTSSPHTRQRILKTARWCRVTAMRKNGGMIVFIGEYGDGSKQVRSYHNTLAWYVKRASMPN